MAKHIENPAIVSSMETYDKELPVQMGKIKHTVPWLWMKDLISEANSLWNYVLRNFPCGTYKYVGLKL